MEYGAQRKKESKKKVTNDKSLQDTTQKVTKGQDSTPSFYSYRWKLEQGRGRFS